MPEKNTGLPETLKADVEKLSGAKLDDIEVHYNTDRPAQLNALAYGQGNHIYVAPGQERHLPHDTWHVVQQKQGRVSATGRTHIGLNRDPKALATERELLAKRTPLK
jgi:hypothetical protein